jgi:hypothetical protein
VERADEQRQVARIVFEIGVLDDDQVARGRGDRRAQGGPLAAVFRVAQQPDAPGCAAAICRQMS